MGFLTLLQKEWVDFGHKFDERCGHTDESASDQRSPVFLLFIDCCFQLLQQFPSAFEFNQDFIAVAGPAERVSLRHVPGEQPET